MNKKEDAAKMEDAIKIEDAMKIEGAMKRKMKVNRNLCFFVICLGIIFVLLEAGAAYGKKAAGFSHTVTILSESSGFDADTIQRIEENPDQEIAFAAWKEIPDSLLSAKESGRTSRADVMAIYGSSYCVMPYGKLIDKEDAAGCLIGKKTAEDLFGSYQVEGQELICEDRTLTVRGVIEEPENLLLCETPLTTDNSFDRISFFAGDMEDGRRTAEDFMNQYGWNAELLRFDFYQNLSWVKELIPGKWSDFSGWKQNLKEQKEQKEQVSRTRKSRLETEYLLLLRKRNICMFSGVLGIATCSVIFVFGVRRQVKRAQKQRLQTGALCQYTSSRQ